MNIFFLVQRQIFLCKSGWFQTHSNQSSSCNRPSAGIIGLPHHAHLTIPISPWLAVTVTSIISFVPLLPCGCESVRTDSIVGLDYSTCSTKEERTLPNRGDTHTAVSTVPVRAEGQCHHSQPFSLPCLAHLTVAEQLGPCSPFSRLVCLFNSLILRLLIGIITLPPFCNKRVKGENTLEKWCWVELERWHSS